LQQRLSGLNSLRVGRDHQCEQHPKPHLARLFACEAFVDHEKSAPFSKIGIVWTVFKNSLIQIDYIDVAFIVKINLVEYLSDQITNAIQCNQ
jgi:hypothetical protein